jgi:hypothetical protein
MILPGSAHGSMFEMYSIYAMHMSRDSMFAMHSIFAMYMSSLYIDMRISWRFPVQVSRNPADIG